MSLAIVPLLIVGAVLLVWLIYLMISAAQLTRRAAAEEDLARQRVCRTEEELYTALRQKRAQS